MRAATSSARCCASVEGIAARGSLTVSRLAPLWMTLERNRQWWTTQPLPASGQRVSFLGSELVWQYYPGQGFQLQPLANFGKLNGLWQGKLYDDRLARMLDELLGIAAQRGERARLGVLLHLRGRASAVGQRARAGDRGAGAGAGRDPARSQGGGAPARRAGARGIFEERPPTGVRVPIDDGAHYAIYSFRPGLRVLNGFLQALVGLSDFAGYANDERARGLFADGDRVARREVPGYDTGAWSLYSRGDVTHESDLCYHRLLTGFLRGLCTRTEQPVYCETESNFARYETEKPKLELLTKKLRGGTAGRLRFRLSKISRVGRSCGAGLEARVHRAGAHGRLREAQPGLARPPARRDLPRGGHGRGPGGQRRHHGRRGRGDQAQARKRKRKRG